MQKIDLNNIPLNDLETIRFLSKAQNMKTIFQLSSNVSKRLLKALMPILLIKAERNELTDVECITTLADINTLIRPSSMRSGSTERYVIKAKLKAGISLNKKESQVAIHAINPKNPFYKLIKKFGNKTYEEIIYQEQLMLMLNELFQLNNLGISDEYRRTLEKNNEEKISKLKTLFYEIYNKDNEITTEFLEEFWNYIQSIAGYLFNKSHAVCYAVLSYETSYLMAHIPNYFLSTCINKCTSDTKESKMEKIEKIISEANRMDIKILLPRINKTYSITTPDIYRDIIYLSPSIILGVGDKVSKVLASKNDFTSIKDFLIWSNNQDFDKTVYEILVKIGFFESFEPDKSKVRDIINNFTFRIKEAREKKYIKTKGIWDYKLKNNADFKEEFIPNQDYERTCFVNVITPLIKNKLCKIDNEHLKYEKELLTFFISNPLEEYMEMHNEVNSNEDDSIIEGKALVYIKSIKQGFKRYFDKKTNNDKIYNWTKIEGISNNKLIQDTFFISEKTKYKVDDIIYIRFSIENDRFNVLHHELFK